MVPFGTVPHLLPSFPIPLTRIANNYSRQDLQLLFAFAEDRVQNPKVVEPARQKLESIRRLPPGERTAEDFLFLAIDSWNRGQVKHTRENAYAGMKAGVSHQRVQAYLMIYLGLASERTDPKFAMNNYLETTKLDPGLYRGHFELARTHFQREEYSEAEREMKKALAKNPDHWIAYEGLAKIYRHLKRYQEAAAYYEKSLLKIPSAHWMRMDLADLYFHHLLQPEKAGALYREAVAQNGSVASARWGLGAYYKYRKDYVKTKAEWREAVRLDPRNVLYKTELGGLYFQIQEYGQAQEQLRAALRMDPKYSPAHYWMGRLYEIGKQPAKAREAYHRALKWDPNNPSPRLRLQILGAADHLLSAGLPPTRPSGKAGAESHPTGMKRGQESKSSQTASVAPPRTLPPPGPPAEKPPGPVEKNPSPQRFFKAQEQKHFPGDLIGDLRIPLGSGWHPIHYAAARGQVDRVRRFLDKGADIEAKNEYGRTPLYVAAKRGELAVVRLLVERGANVNSRETRGGYSPLHIAAGFGQVEVVKYLLEHGANVNARTYYGDTPLMEAVYNSWQRDARIPVLLVKHGTDLKLRNKAGYQVFHYAVQQGHLPAVRFLLDQGVSVEDKASDGATPLFLAVMRNDLELVKTLLNHGANPLNPAKGVTPLDLAKIQKHPEVYAILLFKSQSRSAGNPD